MWRKLGQIWCANGNPAWAANYAALPTIESREGDYVQVIVSPRDTVGRSRPLRLIFDMHELRVVDVEREPLLPLGPPGTFDDSGIMPCWTVKHKGQQYIYYIGWNQAVTVPFQNAIGMAAKKYDDPMYEKVSFGPVLGRSRQEPYFTASCAVLIEGEIWRMWYLSCVDWREHGGNLRHHYHIKYAESANGLDWQCDGLVAIPFQSADEYAISRPSIIRDPDCYRMWYSIRGTSYRIGYAESRDGVTWIRKDGEAGIDISESGWDSEMIAYPYVFDHDGQRYMFYNGNGYGETGFGLAVLEST